MIDKNGHNIIEDFKKAGRFKVFKRTEGVSTTDIVGKLLMLTKSQESPDHSSRDRAGSLDKPLTTN